MGNDLSNGGNLLVIQTLGNFSVKHGDRLLSKGGSRSYRLWELFKFLLTNRSRGVLPEAILEDLWPEQDYSDPKSAVRTLVYRLRQMVQEQAGANEGWCRDLVVFNQGCYQWNTEIPCRLDVDELERLINKARTLVSHDPLGAIAAYKEGVSLYQGEYLPECAYSEWVLAARSYYRRIYLQAVLDLAKLLVAVGRSDESIGICENAIRMEPLEEEVHVCLLEALLAAGKTEQARAHYQHTTATLYRELGVKPSPALRNIYRLLQVDRGHVDLDLGLVQAGLQGRETASGAFICDQEVFRYLYGLEQRRAERAKHPVVVGLVTITGPDYRLPAAGVLKKTMGCLEEAIVTSLRKGDVAARWNEAQYLLMLPGLDVARARQVLDRLEQRFWQSEGVEQGQIILKSSFQPLQLVD